MALTEAQIKRLAEIDKAGSFTDDDDAVFPGLHFCEAWDYLPVCDDSPEKVACRCAPKPRAQSLPASMIEGE